MNKWFFPSRCHGATEGLSNAGLEMFKGEPIRAMAREICQNSLDAKLDDDKPVIIEFQKISVRPEKFPGIIEMKDVLRKCKSFWSNQGDEKTNNFIKTALDTISDETLFVLRVSDYNTTGLQGAFDDEEFTTWKGLVQGDAISNKASDTAAGSYGIGKAAPFVVSKLQTVFYRTYDKTAVRAVQGVTHLASFNDDSVTDNEDSVRRATGYFGENSQNKPMKYSSLLDALNERKEFGTDLFIPGFRFITKRKNNTWKDEIILELLDNFLYSIYSGKLVAVVDGKTIDKSTVKTNIERLSPKSKDAACFYKVISNNDSVTEETKPFHNMGTLRFRVLYGSNLNKKVLVVRNSGMKIAKIAGLPRSITFVGFLEIEGKELNQFFRKMENPQHNKWEPNRYTKNPQLAKSYKNDLEKWVKELISSKISEICGEEMDIDVSSYFHTSEKNIEGQNNETENIIDTVKTINITQNKPKTNTFKIRDVGGSNGTRFNRRMHKGTITDEGTGFGHRTRTGINAGGTPSGRKGTDDEDGNDKIYDNMHKVNVSARIIKKVNGNNKLIFIAKEQIKQGELEIVTIGENGKLLPLKVKSVNGVDVIASEVDGRIVISDVLENIKYRIEFETYGTHSYALGVNAYGN